MNSIINHMVYPPLIYCMDLSAHIQIKFNYRNSIVQEDMDFVLAYIYWA
jgi:hypothetical protein